MVAHRHRGGSGTAFQLVKHSTSGSVTETRTITKPVPGMVLVYKDSILQSSGVTVTTTTGIVTFAAAPANGVIISADFEFDVPVRFDTDKLSATMESYGVTSWSTIPLVEIRV